MRTLRTYALPAVAAVGAATLFAGAGVAVAADVLPGDIPDNHVVLTGSDALDITVGDVENGTVDVTVENSDADQGYTCTGLVTEAGVVSQTMDYYGQNPASLGPLGSLMGLGIPALAGLADTSSLGSLAAPNIQAQNAIQDAQAQAAIAGHTADIAEFTVGPNATSGPTTITLNTPSTGTRADFDPAVYLSCTGADELTYGFAGYNGDSGGSGGTGSLGSDAGGEGSLGDLTGSLGSSGDNGTDEGDGGDGDGGTDASAGSAAGGAAGSLTELSAS